MTFPTERDSQSFLAPALPLPPPAPNILMHHLHPFGSAVAHTIMLSSPVQLLFSGAAFPGHMAPTRHFRASTLSSLLPMVHAARLLLDPASRALQCDLGSNINVTADATLLRHYVQLPLPFDLQGADASVERMSCLGHGLFRLTFLDDTYADVRMYLCPQISETLLSPQAICESASHLFSGFTIHCSALDQSFVRFHRLPGGPDGMLHSDAPLLRSNNLFYFAQLHPHSVPTKASAMRLSRVLTTELWHQRLGYSSMHQLQHRQQCTTSPPSGLHRSVHPFHSRSICDDARSRRTHGRLARADRKSTRLNSSHLDLSRMPSSA